MKLATREIESFLKAPAPAARAVLVYGPDDGLVRERAKILGLTVVKDLNDPFNAVTLTGAQLNEDPARLADEAGAMSMMGGRRLILVRGADDKLTPLLKDYLQNPSPDNLVVIESDNLGPRSPLRVLCEKAANATAIPSYVENERDLMGLIRETLGHAGFGISGDAAQMLASGIVGDRQQARAALDKLVTYMGPAPGYEGLSGAPATGRRGEVTVDDVLACIGGGGELTLDELVYSIAGAKPAEAMRTYDLLLAEGFEIVGMLRVLQNHFRRLHLVKAHMAGGASQDEALQALQPPLFFKHKPAFQAQLSRWPLKTIEQALDRLAALEAQTKKTGTPTETLCGQAFLSLSRR